MDFLKNQLKASHTLLAYSFFLSDLVQFVRMLVLMERLLIIIKQSRQDHFRF